MNTSLNQPKWKVVEYTRSQIVNAGKIIRQDDQNTDEYKSAVDVVDNWRASHAFPLHIIYMHLRRLCSSNNNITADFRK